jgi:NTP pyrophosphatase (non-canonical NTP hydrolase)
MTINEYQNAALRTSRTYTQEQNAVYAGKVYDPDKLLEEGAMGLCGEAGEFIDLIKKWRFQGHPLDAEHLIKELGDICWYLAIAATGIGVTLEYVMQKNIDKLSERYPEGFEVERSVNRKEGDI